MQAPSNDPAPADPGSPAICYENQLVAALADLAPTLKEAELRVLLELARRQLAAGVAIRASSRDLANACKGSRSKIQAALDSLSARGLLTTRAGTSTAPALYRVNVFDTVLMRANTQKQVAPFGSHPPPDTWLPKDATQAPLWCQGGSQREPPPTESKGLPPQLPRVDISTDTNTFDRMLRANPKHLDAEVLAGMRNWLHGYMAKLGPDPQVHPPDDRLVAQFLSLAEPPKLVAFLQALFREGKRPETSYAWFCTVALQRIHGMQPSAQAKRRAQLRIVRAGTAPHPEPEQQSLLADIQRVAAGKTLR